MLDGYINMWFPGWLEEWRDAGVANVDSLCDERMVRIRYGVGQQAWKSNGCARSQVLTRNASASIFQPGQRESVSPCMSIDSKQSPEPLWHPRDAGRFLGIHQKTVIKMARNNQLPALRLGKHWRFRAVDLTRWAEQQVKSICRP